MQRIMGYMRKAIQEYEMIRPGDRIAVGISGGKDSVALVAGLAGLRRFIGVPFELVGITLDPGWNGQRTDYGPIERRQKLAPLCSKPGGNPIPAVCAPECAGARYMTQQKGLGAIKSPWVITTTMRWKHL